MPPSASSRRLSRRSVIGAVAVTVVIVALLVVVIGRLTGPGGDPYAGDFVQTDGTSFEIAGHPFRFVGFNLYNAAAAGEDFYSCVSPRPERYTDSQLDAALAYMHRRAGATVLRFWAYQTYTKSGTDWSGVDEVIRLARKNDMRVIPVLEDGPGFCSTGPSGEAKYSVDGDTWYTTGYQHPFGSAALSYSAYVRRIVAHYKDNPTILGWEMMNEATTAQRVQGMSAIVSFARTIGTVIHSIDPHHLVTVGTESDGYPGASGPDYAAVYGLPQIDFGVAHDYEEPGQKGDYDPTPMNGLLPSGRLPSPQSAACQAATDAPLACSVAQDLDILHKPMVIDEVGVPAVATSRSQLDSRAALFGRKFAAGFDNGVSGELVWEFSKFDDASSGNFDVLSTDDDPLISVMRAQAHVIVGTAPPAATTPTS